MAKKPDPNEVKISKYSSHHDTIHNHVQRKHQDYL